MFLILSLVAKPFAESPVFCAGDTVRGLGGGLPPFRLSAFVEEGFTVLVLIPVSEVKDVEFLRGVIPAAIGVKPLPLCDIKLRDAAEFSAVSAVVQIVSERVAFRP
jgi:hypothetical protein